MSYSDGPHVDLLRVFDWMPKKTEKDYDVMLKRLSLISRQIDQIIDLLQYGVEIGITNHAISMVKLEIQFPIGELRGRVG